MDYVDKRTEPTYVQDSIPWPMNRVSHDDGWRPPAGTRIISVDDHGIEEMGLWETRLKGVDKDRAPKLWQDDEKRFHLDLVDMAAAR